MADDLPRTKEPRRPSRQTPPWPNRPISPIRDARVAAAFERKDDDAAMREFRRQDIDPDAVLKATRDLVMELRQQGPQSADLLQIARELADSFESLDDWLSTCGDFPKSWRGR